MTTAHNWTYALLHTSSLNFHQQAYKHQTHTPLYRMPQPCHYCVYAAIAISLPFVCLLLATQKLVLRDLRARCCDGESARDASPAETRVHVAAPVTLAQA